MLVKCKHWSQSEVIGFGNCAIKFKHLPSYKFCQEQCIHYHEEGLPEGQHTIDKETDKLNDFIAANKTLMFEGRVRKEIADYRLSVCTGLSIEGKPLSAPCRHYSGDSKVRGDGKCAACGCKTWKISEMRIKVYYPMGCPIERFSEMPGRRVANDNDNSGPRPQSKVQGVQGPGFTSQGP
ncbi:MAG: hypothetical protein QQN63_09770 [Nitrosopumilus sp.]